MRRYAQHLRKVVLCEVYRNVEPIMSNRICFENNEQEKRTKVHRIQGFMREDEVAFGISNSTKRMM